jgi:hypothetical protein
MSTAIVIGQTPDYSTWSKLRAVFGPAKVRLNNNRVFYTAAEIAPDLAFRSASDGYGLIKADSVILATSDSSNFRLISTNEQTNPSPPPDKMYDYGVQLSWRRAATGGSFCLVPVEVQNILLGKTVTTANSFAFDISTDLFTDDNGVQIFATEETDDPGYVVSVDTLALIT